MEISWRDATVAIPCPVCGRVDDQTQLCTATVFWQAAPFVVARCGTCNAVVVSDLIPIDVAYTDEHYDWDWYVEQTAGIEAIADLLAKVEVPAGARMLDVGCGFGFGLDLGERLWGWRGIGLDPSPAARIGAEELGNDIRPGLLDDDFVADAPFDVMLIAEVLEHVPDPNALLAHAARHLATDGVLVVTTPDAACVRPDTPETTLLAVLSMGHHQFLVDADGLRSLLERAGLHAEVWAVDATLFAVASPTEPGLLRIRRDRRATLEQLAEYCEERAAGATPGSPLDVGMRMRRVKFLAYRGDFPGAAAEMPGLRDAILTRHNVDLDDPDAIGAMAQAPLVMVIACYFAGVMARYVDQRPDHAARLFGAAAVCGERQYDRFARYVDPEVPQFEMQSRGELALILAETDPDAARRALDALDGAAARAGYTSIADDYRNRVAAIPLQSAPEPADGDDAARGLRATVRRRLQRRSND